MKQYECSCIIDNMPYSFSPDVKTLAGNAYDMFSDYLKSKGADIDYVENLAIDEVDYHE